MAKHKAEPQTELKKAMGRQIAIVKDKAREALPNGSPEALADKANEIAPSMGFEPDFTAERFIEKAPGKPRGTKTSQGQESPAALTLDDYKVYRKALNEEGTENRTLQQ